jgi:hypothetical protein
MTLYNHDLMLADCNERKKEKEGIDPLVARIQVEEVPLKVEVVLRPVPR